MWTSANSVLCLLTFVWRWSRIAMTLNAGVPPLGSSKTSVKYDLILNIRKNKPSLVFNNNGYMFDNIKCKYKNRNHCFGVSSSDEKKKLSLMKTGRGSSIRSEFAWHANGPEFDPHIRHILSWRLGHENISMAILPLPLLQEEQLSVTGERMCTKYW